MQKTEIKPRINCGCQSRLERASGSTYEVHYCPRVCQEAAESGDVVCPGPFHEVEVEMAHHLDALIEMIEG